MSDYLYAYVECARKGWHLGGIFDTWEPIGFDRGDFVEHHTFRKPLAEATAADWQLAIDYQNSRSVEAAAHEIEPQKNIESPDPRMKLTTKDMDPCNPVQWASDPNSKIVALPRGESKRS